MKKRIVGILVSIMLVTSFMVVFPINDVQSIGTTLDVDDGDVKQIIQDFVSSSGDSVTAADIVSFVNGNAQGQLASSSGFIFGSEYIFNAASTHYISAADLSSSKFLVAYNDGHNSGYGTAVIGEVTGNTISYGSEYVFNAAYTRAISAAALSSNKFVVAYNDGAWYNGTAVVGTVSGNTISFGLEYVFNPAHTSDISAAALTSSKFVVAYEDGYSSGLGTAIIGDVSGDTISYGSEYVNTAHAHGLRSVAALSSDKFVVAFFKSDPVYHGVAQVGDVTGNTIDFGSLYVFNDNPTSDISAAALTSNKFVVAYSDVGPSHYGTAVVGTVSGKTISFGLEYVFNPASTVDISAAALTSSKFVVAYTDEKIFPYYNGEAVIGDVSGTIISYGGKIVFNPAFTEEISAAALTSTKIVIAYRDMGNSSYGTAVVGDENPAPNTPNIPGGPTILGVGEFGLYATQTSDPDGDQIQYRFDWDANGAHDYSGWTSLVPSGQSGSLQNSWTSNGTYVVKAQARDEYGITSDWSGGQTVAVFWPPYIPTIPFGPTSLEVGESGSYSTKANDPNEYQVQYRFDWDDGIISDWTSLVPSGQPGSKSHSWSTPGTYYVRSQARNENGVSSGWSNCLTVIVEIENQPPNTPSISGKTNGKAGTMYEYTFSATDPEDDDVSFYVDWGDDTSSGWTEFVASEAEVKLKHAWVDEDTFTIRAKAKDEYGAESDWGTLEVSMPVSKQSTNMQVLRFLEILIGRSSVL